MTGSYDAVVVGGTLAGMAAAARLARNRHRVLLVAAEQRLGGRWAAQTMPSDPDRDLGTVEVDALPGMITFPAPWRDLFRKSGRAMSDELSRADLALVPAPAARHVFDDGTDLVLPTDRGVQQSVLLRRYGDAVADRWRDLLDHLDDQWQALRPLGGEAELVHRDQLRDPVLQPRRRVSDVAAGIDEPHLAALITSTAWRLGSDPRRTPGWCAVQLSTERRFGRWMMAGESGPVRTSTLVDLLAERLRQRRVPVVVDTPARLLITDRQLTGIALGATQIAAPVVIWADRLALLDAALGRHAAAERRARRGIRPAWSPAVRHRVLDQTTPEATETVRHTAAGPVITWTRPLAGGRTLESVHDWPAGHPDPEAGIAWHGVGTALRRPATRSVIGGLYLAGPWSRGGADLAHIVLSGALASYAAHDQLRAAPPDDGEPR